MDFSLIVECLRNLSNAINQIIHIPYIGSVFCFLLNFFIASIASYLSIEILSGKAIEIKKIILEMIKRLEDRRFKKIYRKFIIKYCMTAGFFAAIFIDLQQFECFQIAYAALYGVIGPHIVIDRLRKVLLTDSIKSSESFMDHELLDIDKLEKQDYINKISNEFKKTLDNTLLDIDKLEKQDYDINKGRFEEGLRRVLR